MVCPLCGQRTARRTCPALGKRICAICCGTKRLIEIQCPADCPYLASAREHPPVVAVRRRQHDLSTLAQAMQDLGERQSRLFSLILTFLARYEAPLQPLVDDDVIEATGALAATFETAARGVIYEHRPTSLPAERLANSLKPLLAEAEQGAGPAFQRDAAVVLRRIEATAREARQLESGPARAFMELIGRVIRKQVSETRESGEEEDTPRIIIP